MRILQFIVWMLYGITLGMMIGDRGIWTGIPVIIGLTISITALIIKLNPNDQH